MSTGRNFDEALRLFDSCRPATQHQVAMPIAWRQGEDCVIVLAVSDEAAKQKHADGWTAPMPCIDRVPQPKREQPPMRAMSSPDDEHLTRLVAAVVARTAAGALRPLPTSDSYLTARPPWTERFVTWMKRPRYRALVSAAILSTASRNAER